MNKNKIDTYIRFAIKSRKIIHGLDKIKLRTKQIKIIIADKTLSDNSLEKTKILSDRFRIPLILSEDDLNHILNTINCKIIGITDESLSKAILDNLGNGYYLAEGELNGRN
ncbi:MAG TPA: hypothetical protein GX745_02390 [Clostridiales bacterium]|jgi:hypothetical protein|nr:hypothetical protein [Clostridiales bacterium]